MGHAANEKIILSLLGNNIKTLRNGDKINQIDLANKLELSRTSLVNIEKGRQAPSLLMLWKIADALDVELAEILPSRSEVTAASKGLQKINDEYIKNEDVYDRLHEFKQILKQST